jgi:two-component system, NarL family, response regulator LiaR
MIKARLRLLLAEDDASVRSGYKTMFEDEGLQVIAEADSAETAIEKTLLHRPDVVLMDLSMPTTGTEMGGLEAVKGICEHWQDAKILVLTNHGGDERVLKVLRAGAMGYVVKRCSFDEILAAVRKVATGDCHVTTEMMNELRVRIMREGTDSSLEKREAELIRLTSKGIPSEMIAIELNISTSLMKQIWRDILTKLGVENKFRAIDVARIRGFIE